MRKFVAQQWRLLFMLVVLLSWVGLFAVWSRWVSAPPLEKSISLLTGSTVNADIHIVVPETYELKFVFSRAAYSFEELKDRIGAMGLCSAGEACSNGMPVRLRWQLRNVQTDTVAASNEGEFLDSSAWSDADVERHIATVAVSPGRYNFTAEVLSDAPKLAQLDPKIAMELRPKFSTSWQLGVVWWGSVINLLLVWPTAIILGLMLLWRGGLTWRSARRAKLHRALAS